MCTSVVFGKRSIASLVEFVTRCDSVPTPSRYSVYTIYVPGQRLPGGGILLAFCTRMRHGTLTNLLKYTTAAALIYLTSLPGFSLPQTPQAPVLTASQKETVKAFDKRVKDYVSLRESLERKLPNLSSDAKPEEIETHKKAFEDSVRKARANAKPGDVFTPDIAGYIRTTLKTEFKGTDRKEVRETVLEADTKGVLVRVNYPYPETKELGQVPPTVLLKLPQLPKQMRYRFVRRHLLLVDRENGLIVDYMQNALP